MIGDAGAVTVEAAFAVASIVAVAILCFAGVGAVTAHVRCVEAAREAARLVARGDDSAREVAESVAPPGARVDIRIDGEAVTVRVAADTSLPAVTVSAEAVAVRERSGADG